MGGYMGRYIGACFSGNENKIQNEIGFRDNENVIVICSTDKGKEMKLKTTQLPDTGWCRKYDNFGRDFRSCPVGANGFQSTSLLRTPEGRTPNPLALTHPFFLSTIGL